MTGAAAARLALRAPAEGLAGLVRGYQRWVSPLFGPHCRFYPSCSAYAVTALRRHGLVKGGALAVWRLARCQPFSPGGVDHVPARRAAGGRSTERAARAGG
ncbi:MAG: membrane protein insertion efficiency factor YidD [Bifidobacteriaceae bacterium]|nr:membrane protein insertion efficiency factor YidD [Bifidobacteriaceae bacterium]